MKKYKLVLPSQPRESVLSTKLESFYDRELLEGARMFNSGTQVHFREYTPINVQKENNDGNVCGDNT